MGDSPGGTELPSAMHSHIAGSSAALLGDLLCLSFCIFVIKSNKLKLWSQNVQ